MRARGGDGKRGGGKIGWEMRDCVEPKSQPAGPACCLRDCKLSLRMQTDKQDRHHLPILPSTTETAAHASPFCFPPFFSLPPRSIFHTIFPSFSPVCTHVYEHPLSIPSVSLMSQALRYFLPVAWSLFRL